MMKQTLYLTNNGILKREYFNEIVKNNNFLEKDDDLPEDISLKIDQC